MHGNRRSILCGRFKAVLLYRLDGLPIQSISGWLLHTYILRIALRVNNKCDEADCMEILDMFLLGHLSRLV